MSPTRRSNAWPLAAQLNSFARASPPCPALSRASASCSAVHIASAISSASPGDTSASAAFPHTSGRDVTLDAMTGTPQAMASNTGMPNPSNQGTNTSASPAPITLGNSSWGKRPKLWMRVRTEVGTSMGSASHMAAPTMTR
ncbi:MAG: hypothetical protein CL835_02190 [Crocinitomicaceae bacterium]|nr:hypothetical protein [Crocinitomicaceae bacterium]